MTMAVPTEREFRKRLSADAGPILETVGVGPGQVLLDFGCGSGECAIAAARIVGPAGKVYALDVKGRALRKLTRAARAEGLANVETIAADGSPATRLGDESADVVLLYDVIQKIDDRVALLGELARVLRADGFLSVFPMHVGPDKLMEHVRECGLFTLTAEHYGHVFNFRKAVS